jgi:hypothetical protein
MSRLSRFNGSWLTGSQEALQEKQGLKLQSPKKEQKFCAEISEGKSPIKVLGGTSAFKQFASQRFEVSLVEILKLSNKCGLVEGITLNVTLESFVNIPPHSVALFSVIRKEPPNSTEELSTNFHQKEKKNTNHQGSQSSNITLNDNVLKVD